jgi:hypothetical protein
LEVFFGGFGYSAKHPDYYSAWLVGVKNDEGPKAAHQQSFSRRNCPVQNLA